MGCCLSTKQPSKKPDKCGGAPELTPPPPPAVPVEEETVKEVLVLSETPIPKPSAPEVAEKNSDRYMQPENQELKIQSTAEIKQPMESTVVIKPAEDVISEVSEHSELCSFTESFSTTATGTGLDKRDDGEEVNQRSPMRILRKRANAGDIAGGRERSVRSPARRPVPSPEKRKPVASSRPVQGRAMVSQRKNVGVGVGPSNGLRRDSGEGSARRSRSPVTRSQVGSRQNQNVRYRSPGLSENGRSGGRSPARALDNGVKMEKSNDDVVLPESSNVEKRNDDVPDETSESLENPFVSLECFIFL